MRMIEIFGELPRTFMSFCRLEKESKLQGRRQSEENQPLSISSPGAYAEAIKIPEIDTSPVRTMTVLQSVQPLCSTNSVHVSLMHGGV